MLEGHLQRLATDDPGLESSADTRTRLKGHFAPGATRRMTTLGMLVGRVVSELGPGGIDAIVYASEYAESSALEGFLDSFPSASPTLFQTSIHPSAVQQMMIARQTPVPELFPLSGGPLFAFHALRAALLSPSPTVLLCGGEERGSWLLEHGLASNRTFAFAARVAKSPAGSLARILLTPGAVDGSLALAAWFDLLHRRLPFAGPVAPGWRLDLEWR
ncbi:MAG TPA: hypothetical protein VGG37_05070 [Opitutaceae bacterium]|jgi:hypothetical protein